MSSTYWWDVHLCWSAGFLPRPATSSERETKDNAMDYIIAGIASLGLLVYLVYALLCPERF